MNGVIGLLVIWGRYDLSFDVSEPEAYHRDVPNAEVHILEPGISRRI
jgi:pimeloyl-ACP methyl ester carboxylesterase